MKGPRGWRKDCPGHHLDVARGGSEAQKTAPRCLWLELWCAECLQREPHHLGAASLCFLLNKVMGKRRRIFEGTVGEVTSSVHFILEERGQLPQDLPIGNPPTLSTPL